MINKTASLGTLCTIKTGAPISRARKLQDGDSGQEAMILIPRAMDDGCIIDENLVTETISKVKDELFTREGDVVLKASTPFDCVYIDGEHEGILVTSFGMILRPLQDSTIDTRYLAVFLNHRQTNDLLQGMSKGMTLQLLKKKDIETLEVPLASAGDQRKIASLFENTQSRKKHCRELIAASDLLLESEFARAALN